MLENFHFWQRTGSEHISEHIIAVLIKIVSFFGIVPRRVSRHRWQLGDCSWGDGCRKSHALHLRSGPYSLDISL